MSTPVNRATSPDAEPELRPRASRAPLVHAVMCRYAGTEDFVEVTTLNISQSGMLVRADELPPVGCELEFKFVLESGFELLTGKGKVMRHAGEPNANAVRRHRVLRPRSAEAAHPRARRRAAQRSGRSRGG